MNPNNYTQKSLEAIQGAQDIALANNNQQIEQIHLLQSLLQSQNGLIPQLLKRMGVSPENLEAVAAQEIRKLPQVTGGGREAGKYYIGRPVDNAFREAEQAAERMKDDFVSVEHLFIGLLRSPDATLKLLFSRQGITEEAVLQALQGVRGTQRVTNDNPEDTYEALEKYGTDLVRRRPRRRDPQCHPHPLPQDQEQSLPYRRARRRQDRHRRGPGPAHRQGRRAQEPAGQDHLLPGHGRADCRREVPRRI